jgi:phage repressor protein C with HTH and peptisase S24 domain
MMNPKAQRLRWARQAAGHANAASFARAAEVSEVTYRAYENGTRNLPENAARELAQKLGVNWVWLFTGEGEPRASRKGRAAESVASSPFAPQPFAAGSLGGAEIDLAAGMPMRGVAALKRDVPVRGTVIGGDDGDFTFNGDVVDLVRRPPGLAGASAVFAVYVHGDSMSPRFESGDLVFVNPSRPPTPGCDVIVEMAPQHGEGAGACYIKRLLRRTADKVVLRQFNPPAGEKQDFEIEHKRIRNLWRVLTPAELLGL